jgi:malonyl-CoA/methylmalonyl-CoA synthetase
VFAKVKQRLGGRLRMCVSGAAPLSLDVLEFFNALGILVVEGYGLTETSSSLSVNQEDNYKLGTVGPPVEGCEVKLDEDGEILVKSPSVFVGYFKDPDATAAAFTDDGWFRTGDVGEHDADGYLRIVGRSKELIITGGLNVYPREVEDVLLQHPAVAEVAVGGLPDPEWGEVVTAWVVPARGASPPPVAELTGFAAERLARFKCPRQVRFVESLPRNALGKVLRHELRA